MQDLYHQQDVYFSPAGDLLVHDDEGMERINPFLVIVV